LGRRGSNGRLRIIGGCWRGRRIGFTGVEALRPTPDRVRETLFNWLAPYVEGARVLDLYAGSGILGFEALSRGAASVTAVDCHRRVADRLRATAAELGAEGYHVVATDAEAFLAGGGAGPFDLVFIDPPHATADYDRVCERLETGDLMRLNALVYLEFSTPRASTFNPPSSWQPYRSSRAGGVTFQLWRRSD